MDAGGLRLRRLFAIASMCALFFAACGGDDGQGDRSLVSTTTSSSVSSTGPPAAERGYQADVEALADDAMEGSDNQTPGSARAQEYIVDRLMEFAEPLGDNFRHQFAEGTNLLAIIPGSELPAEYLILGAHYDHLGRDCRSTTPGDDICNGATDNAAGVATVLEIGRRLAAAEEPRRSVVLALWDAEEDGLLGSTAYVADPAVPIEDTVAYLNWDTLGSNLLPSLADLTVMVGAETGGPALVEAAASAAAGSDLEPVALSLLFGQGRSDHAVFASAGVPTVFSTDATGGCYHTAQDDLTAVDLEKLGREIDIGEALALNVANTAAPPTYVAGTPPATYDDARSLLEIVDRAEPDFELFPQESQATATQYLADLQSMVDAGRDAFDEEAVGTLLGGAVELVLALAQLECNAFVD